MSSCSTLHHLKHTDTHSLVASAQLTKNNSIEKPLIPLKVRTNFHLFRNFHFQVDFGKDFSSIDIDLLVSIIQHLCVTPIFNPKYRTCSLTHLLTRTWQQLSLPHSFSDTTQLKRSDTFHAVIFTAFIAAR